MSKVYITGHRNPDIDSLCAASAYANLKNMTDPENEYIAIHCSPVSDQVKEQMEAMGVAIPPYRKDVYPKVRDVMLEPQSYIQADAPIFALVNAYSAENPSVVPIYDGEKFKGLLSVDDITRWFLSDNKEEIPTYRLTIDNILRVIPGKLLHRGKSETIEGSLLVGAASYEAFSGLLEDIGNCIVVLGIRKELIEYAIKRQVPAIIIAAADEAPDVDYSGYEGSVFMTDLGTAETLRRIRLAETVESMMELATETIDIDDLFTHRHRRSVHRGQKDLH